MPGQPSEAQLARWRACALDPWLFARVYLPRHVVIDGTMSMADLHRELVDVGRSWTTGMGTVRPGEDRSIWVAPRGCGKSTWLFLILPMWAAAFGYTRFIAAFADSGPQAENHLTTFKHELDTNELLRHDFPKLCNARKRITGVNEADRHGLYISESGFIFAARGIDASSLGLKIGDARPDLIILDDIEPDEGSYSAYQMKKRKGTVLDAVLPLNIYARVVLVGTVTMAGSLIHQAVKAHRGEFDTENEWVKAEGFRVHHVPAIATRADGTERSTWPEKWSIEFLQSIRSTRSYAKNYANDPMGADGGFWTPEDFRYGHLEAITRTLLSIDPNVTDPFRVQGKKNRSDYTGLAVIGYDPTVSKCEVHAAEAVKLTGDPLRSKVVQVLERHPEIGLILVEVNQGGDLWLDILHDLPVRVKPVHQSEKKETRAARVLSHYQRGRVLHSRPFPALEEQMAAFPLAPNDDLVDAVGSGVERFLGKKPVRRSGATTVPYA